MIPLLSPSTWFPPFMKALRYDISSSQSGAVLQLHETPIFGMSLIFNFHELNLTVDEARLILPGIG